MMAKDDEKLIDRAFANYQVMEKFPFSYAHVPAETKDDEKLIDRAFANYLVKRERRDVALSFPDLPDWSPPDVPDRGKSHVVIYGKERFIMIYAADGSRLATYRIRKNGRLKLRASSHRKCQDPGRGN